MARYEPIHFRPTEDGDVTKAKKTGRGGPGTAYAADKTKKALDEGGQGMPLRAPDHGDGSPEEGRARERQKSRKSRKSHTDLLPARSETAFHSDRKNEGSGPMEGGERRELPTARPTTTSSRLPTRGRGRTHARGPLKRRTARTATARSKSGNTKQATERPQRGRVTEARKPGRNTG